MTEKRKTIFDKSQTGNRAYSLPKDDEAFYQFTPPKKLLREEKAAFPEVSELDLTRHFSLLAHKNMSIDTNFYPLGSCTMKLNPRVCEQVAALKGFKQTHPFAPEESVEGNLQLIQALLRHLCHILGMPAGTVLPNAGAQGEFVGLKMIKAYHREREDFQRDEVLIPDNAHGTNPASATLAGYKTRTIISDMETGDIDLESLKSLLSHRTAALMLTNPNTLGLFSENIMEIAKLVHKAGGLLYYDGANLNPILNIVRPGDMGFDVMHINLHKTFSTPHGGGGPGGAPVFCSDQLKPFLPTPYLAVKDNNYELIWDDSRSMGKITNFHGNFSILVRAYLYIKLHGNYGLRRIAEAAIINANYLKHHLSKFLTVPFKDPCMHEFVIQGDRFLNKGIKALDIAKRLLDYQIHAPTIYFPLIIKECMLIEPTETESKATLDRFIAVMEMIVQEIEQDNDMVKTAPHSTLLQRLDEVMAARQLLLHA